MSVKVTQNAALRSFVRSSNVPVLAHNVEQVPLVQGSQITEQFVNVRRGTSEVRTLSAEPNATEIVTALQEDRLVSTEFVRTHAMDHAE